MLKVSVIIPVYNGAAYLDEALDSVDAQTFTDYELICVDDGSTDESVSLLQRRSSPLTLIRQANAGQGAARNAGASRASGEYLAFLDQDDRWYPSKLDRQVSALDADHGAVLAYCETDRVDRTGRMMQRSVTSHDRPKALASALGRIVGEQLILPSSMLVRRAVFHQVGGFDPLLTGYEDFDLCTRLRKRGPFLFVQEPGLLYRSHEDGFSRAGGWRVLQSQERFLLNMQQLADNDPEKLGFIHRLLAECYSDQGMHKMRGGSLYEARQCFFRSLHHNPWKWRTYSRLARALSPLR